MKITYSEWFHLSEMIRMFLIEERLMEGTKKMYNKHKLFLRICTFIKPKILICVQEKKGTKIQPHTEQNR